jgi:hypothetical protein
MAPAANSRNSVADAGWNCASNGFEDRIPRSATTRGADRRFSWSWPTR